MEIKEREFEAILRTDLSSFTQKVFRTVSPGADYLHNWHIDLACEYLMACTTGDIKRLIINIPPRYMKSITVNVAWPAWLLGHNPTKSILSASYAESLSIKHSIDCRHVIKQDWYKRLFPYVGLLDDQNAKSKFITTYRGQRLATSVGGAATGEGGDFLIVDDPQNPLMAASELLRSNCINWFEQTFMTRLNNKKTGVVVIIMQRLHENDLTGHLLGKEGNRWTHLCLPLEAEKKTIIDFGNMHIVREAGDYLHPERDSKKEVEALKADLGSYAYAGQCQQRPSPLEGGIVKYEWLRRYEKKEEKYTSIVQSWDTAFKADQLNDPSVCTTWGVKNNGYELLNVYRGRVEYPKLKEQCMRLATDYDADAILIEDKASGQSLIQDLRQDTDLPVIGIRPEADKITRMASVSSLIEAGKMWLPKDALWLSDYESELLTFPNATHDDQVDSTSQFLNWMRKKANKTPSIRTL